MIKTHSASISNFINCFEQELHQCFKFEIIENENLILGEKKFQKPKNVAKIDYFRNRFAYQKH